MDIRSSLDGLKSLLGTNATAPATVQQPKSGATPGGSALGADSATLSSAGSEVSQTASDHISASAVASKVVDSMLASQS